MPWRRALFWGLMPIAGPQGLRLKRTAPRFAPAPGEREGATGEGHTLRLLAIGDSVMDGVGVPHITRGFAAALSGHLAQRLECRVEWRVLGRTGACVREVREQLVPAVPRGAWDLVVVSVGVNDVSGLTRSAAFAARLDALVAGLRERAPTATVLLCGLPRMQYFPLLPQPLRWIAGLRAYTLDAIAAEVAARHAGVLHEPTTYMPAPHEFAPDGYHANAETQARWADVLAARLLSRWRPAIATPMAN